jgi:CRISPR-associated endonuclease Csn1
MGKILGLDLGTNSIGWAIRDTDAEIENQIIDYGVIAFKKGVGDGKSGEFSLAAERRKNRSKRRLYNAKHYRKWATLKVIMQNNMCPISEEELRLWSIGNWKNDEKNKRKNLSIIT